MSAPAIVDRPLPYAALLAARDAGDVDIAVIHCTELPDLATAREYGERLLYESGTGNSGHYYVDRDGRIECWVAPTRVAHHVRGYNERAVGIELVNRGRYPDWYNSHRQRPDEAYPEAQVDALCALLADLRLRLPRLERIAGHEDLDTDWIPARDDPAQRVRRKLDPGPLFPWHRLDGLGLRRLRP